MSLVLSYILISMVYAVTRRQSGIDTVTYGRAIGVVIGMISDNGTAVVLFESHDIRSVKHELYFVRLPTYIDLASPAKISILFDYEGLNNRIKINHVQTRGCFVEYQRMNGYAFDFRCYYKGIKSVYSISFYVSHMTRYTIATFIIIPNNYYNSIRDLGCFMHLMSSDNYIALSGYNIDTRYELHLTNKALDNISTNDTVFNVFYALGLLRKIDVKSDNDQRIHDIKIPQYIVIYGQPGQDYGGLTRLFYTRILSVFSSILFKDNKINQGSHLLFHDKNVQNAVSYAYGWLIGVLVYLKYEAPKFVDILWNNEDIPPIIFDIIIGRFEMKPYSRDSQFLRQYEIMHEYKTQSNIADLMRNYLHNKHINPDKIGREIGREIIEQLKAGNVDKSTNIDMLSGHRLKAAVKKLAVAYFNEIEMNSNIINQMRKGFQFNIFGRIIRNLPEISLRDINEYFIRDIVGCEGITTKVDNYCANNVYEVLAHLVCVWFLDIIRENEKDVQFCKILYNFWCGSDFINPNVLEIHIYNESNPKWITSHSCFNDIELYYYPNMNESLWKHNVYRALFLTGNRFDLI